MFKNGKMVKWEAMEEGESEVLCCNFPPLYVIGIIVFFINAIFDALD